MQYFSEPMFWPSLVYDCDLGVKKLCQPASPLCTAHIRRNYYTIFYLLIIKVVCDKRQRFQIVNWDVKETLDLVYMKIEGDNPMHTCSFDQVSYQLCANRFAGNCFPILPGIAIVWYDRINLFCRSSFASIYDQEQLHEMVIDWLAGRLQYEYNGTPHAFFNVNIDFTIIEPFDLYGG